MGHQEALQQLRRVYFIGIGGIGMSALARYFLSRGVEVAGYDRHSSELTQALEREGAAVSYVEDVESVPLAFCQPDGHALVVYTPAVGADDVLLRFFTQQGLHPRKRSEVLGWISEEYDTYAIAGTHGKTTTATILSYVLQGAAGCSAFLGGVSRNFGTNWVEPNRPSRLLVVEADEYDRSFLTLQPELPLVTSVAPDHLDYYGTFDAVVEAFQQFAARSRSGKLVCHHSFKDYFESLGLELITYGVEAPAKYVARDVRYARGRSYFQVETPSGERHEVELGVPGRHNVENGLAVLAMCAHAGVALARAADFLPSFQGVARRFSVMYSSPALTYIDDYAHHPDEIRATLRAAREMFPEKHITAVFQPHLYSRTRDLANDFAMALSGFDSVLLLPIYPAREAPIPGVCSEMLLELLPRGVVKSMVTPETLMGVLHSLPTEVLITLGAGDVGELAPCIVAELQRNGGAR